MEQAIFAALPSTSATFTLAESLTKMENLAETALYKFSSIAAQSLVAEVTAALKSLMRGQAPVMTSWAQSPMMMKLKNDVIPLFLMTVMPADSEGQERTLRGLAAAKWLELDEDIRVIIIKGEGPSFCAGYDMTPVKKGERQRSPHRFGPRPKSGASVSWPASTMPRRMARVRVK